ncbi:NADH dehydrogenase subunit 6 (mitochondrion) [Sergentomyia squamirostris]
MLNLIISFFNIMSSLTFISMNHPLAMGLMLLIQTTLVSLMIGMMMKTFWFSYILFLTFLGGMLVLFIYVTSLASNEMFTFSSKNLIIVLYLSAIFIITTLFIDKSLFLNLFNNKEMNSIFNFSIIMKENYLNLNKLYSYPMNLTLILMVNYLLLTLIIIVKMTDFNSGPLRTNYK